MHAKISKYIFQAKLHHTRALSTLHTLLDEHAADNPPGSAGVRICCQGPALVRVPCCHFGRHGLRPARARAAGRLACGPITRLRSAVTRRRIERRCDRAADVWPLATVISPLIPADRLLARSKPLGKHSPAHDLKTIAEEGDEPTADEEHDAVVDKFEPTVPASAPQEAKISGSVTIEPDASTGHVPRVVLKLNVPLSVPPLNDAEMVDAEVIDQLEVDKPSAPAPEQVPAKAQKRKAVRVKVKKEAVRSMPYRVSRHHGSGFYSEQNLVNLQWKGSGSRFDPVLIL